MVPGCFSKLYFIPISAKMPPGSVFREKAASSRLSSEKSLLREGLATVPSPAPPPT
jgi:hypothetical protein